MNHDVPIESLIDHIKTSLDVDPWAKEMSEDFLKKFIPVKAIEKSNKYYCGACGIRLQGQNPRFCYKCGQAVKRDG